MDLERAIEFLLDQQAASQARFDAQQARMEERAQEQQARFDAQMTSVTAKQDRVSELQAKTEATLRRAIRLSVEEHRRERVRRQKGDEVLSQKLAELSTETALTQHAVREFINSLKQPHNGHDKV
jgi:predicted nuclease with TOPRIM domain